MQQEPPPIVRPAAKTAARDALLGGAAFAVCAALLYLLAQFTSNS